MTAHQFETTLLFNLGDAAELEIDVTVDYRVTWGAPAHYGSLTYPGHPADPDEVEIEDVTLREVIEVDGKKTYRKLEEVKWLIEWIDKQLDGDHFNGLLIEKAAADGGEF
jgi:hypothetical protein